MFRCAQHDKDEIMFIQGEKIVLRSVVPSDADILYKWENDRSNWDISGTKKPFGKKEIKEFITNQKDIYLDQQLRLMVCINSPLKKGDKGVVEVGCIDLFNFDSRNLKAGVGILIEKKYHKKGYASEALSLLIKYSFKTLSLRELFCSISEDNTGSLKLFQNQGFKIRGKKNGVLLLSIFG